MGLGPSLRLSLGLGVFATALGGCAAPADDELGSAELAATSPELRASKWTRLWSDLPMERGGAAHYRACEGQSFRFTLAFRNMGSAIWRDQHGRGDEVGSDVFLETASGKKDTLAGKKRFSLRWNSNDWVRGDRKAKECTTTPGCRRTRAIHDGIRAKAPTQPGIYKSRWRLRDYSEAWPAPKGFGPKVELRVRVVDCPEPGECACKVSCSDGSKTVLWLVGGSESECKSGAQLHCLPYDTVSTEFVPCPTGGTGGTGGTVSGAGGSSGEVNAEAPPDGPGFWITDADDGSSGSGGSGGSGGTVGSGGSGGSWWWSGEDDPGMGSEVPDDPDWESDGFDGVAEEVESGVIPVEESACALSPALPRASGGALALVAALAAWLARRASKREL